MTIKKGVTNKDCEATLKPKSETAVITKLPDVLKSI